MSSENIRPPHNYAAAYLLTSAEVKEQLSGMMPGDIAAAITTGIAAVAAYKSAAVITVDGTQSPSSFHAGELGESLVETILRREFCKVDNVSSVNHSGDLHLHVHTGRRTPEIILVEVKNYTRSVPSAQVDKFLEDLATGAATISAGMFVSLNTEITGFSERFTLRFEAVCGRLIPCVYVCSSDGAAIIACANLLCSLLREDLVHPCDEADFHRLRAAVDSLRRKGSKLSESVSTAHMQLVKSVYEIGSEIAAVSSTLSAAEDGSRQISSYGRDIDEFLAGATGGELVRRLLLAEGKCVVLRGKVIRAGKVSAVRGEQNMLTLRVKKSFPGEVLEMLVANGAKISAGGVSITVTCTNVSLIERAFAS